MKTARLRLVIVSVSFLIGLSFLSFSAIAHAQDSSKGELIAFIRNADVWIMNPDGSNQRPLVAGIENAKGKISWEPGNKRLAFTRKGELTLKYPGGGGGTHRIYDLFFAFLDSTNNFWEGFTETLGAQSPDWSADGSKIAFTYDVNAVISNSIRPQYKIGFYDLKTRVISELRLPTGSDYLYAISPSLSPDGSRVAFVLAKFDGKRPIPLGIVVTSASKITMTAEQLMAKAKELSNGTSPSWSPDGKRIAYISTDMSNPGIYVVKPDLTGKKRIWKASGGLTLQTSPPSWSPDSKKLAFGTGNGAIYTVNADGTNATLISGPGSDMFPAWSK